MERKVVLVTRKTRLETLITRFNTRDQARFYVEHLGADFSDYEREQAAYDEATRTVQETLEIHGRWQAVDRAYLPNFLFGPDDIVVALGQDGLVANTMKYLQGRPLIGINPEPGRYDGVLLPFTPKDLRLILPQVLWDSAPVKRVTMAEARLSDGQTMLAVNDLFIGPRSHVSARYEIDWNGRRERQSSSGVIVSTGLGSTGWMSSIVTGSLGIGAAWSQRKPQADYRPLQWDDDTLLFAVREPFPSQTTGTSIIFGRCDAASPLRLTSLMAEGGVIFSDGMEADSIEFGAGQLANVQPAATSGILVV